MPIHRQKKTMAITNLNVKHLDIKTTHIRNETCHLISLLALIIFLQCSDNSDSERQFKYWNKFVGT